MLTVSMQPAAAGLDTAVARLERWLESMRGPNGYGGPVVHWWHGCLVFCGGALDWRYEGIIAGYLTLFERTGDRRWLDRARRAGDDLVRGQLASGNFRNSAFELNPGIGGTPHEAAADLGLLLLTRTLRALDQPGWEVFLHAADRNLRHYYLERLWQPADQLFWDASGSPSFVPNKSATLIDALCLLVEQTGREEYLERYVRPTADAILAHQVRLAGGPLDGAIAQNTLGRTLVPKYFPYYNARCVPGLLAAAHWLGDERYVDAALAAVAFAFRWRDPAGAFPQVIYPDGRVNRFPRWIAAVGDILRASALLRQHGFDCPLEPTEGWLLAGQLPSGAIATADGFGAQVSQRPAFEREFRDLLPVCGWVDKAFRYLAGRVSGVPDVPEVAESALACTFRGRRCHLHEDEREIALRYDGRPVYRWRKGSDWAEVRAPWGLTR